MRLKRSCQRWRGAPSGGRVLMGRQSYRPRHSTARAAGSDARHDRAGRVGAASPPGDLRLLHDRRRPPPAVAGARARCPPSSSALALAFVLDPGVTALARRGVPRWAGVLVSYVGAVAVIWAVLAFVLPPITAQAREFMQQLPELGASVGDFERALIEWYEGLPLPAELREAIEEQLAASGEAIARFPGRPPRADHQCGRSRGDVPVRPGRRPGLALLRPQGSRELLAGGRLGDAPVVASGRRERARNARTGWRPMGPGPASARRIDLPGHRDRPHDPDHHRLQRIRPVHAGPGAHRRRAGVGPDHRPDHRRDPRHPHRPDDLAPCGRRGQRCSTSSSSSSRTTSWCRRSWATRSICTRRS